MSPTRDGSVWDIQLVTMAMVLSTAPIFRSGTVIVPPPPVPPGPPRAHHTPPSPGGGTGSTGSGSIGALPVRKMRFWGWHR